MSDDWTLLHAYAHERSEDAFARLVARHAQRVFHTALRRTRHRQLAEDVTQAVFICLARSATAIRPTGSLGGWLHQTTLYASANALRAEVRRQRRERTVVRTDAIASTGEEAAITMAVEEEMQHLGESDRQVLFLHYIEGKTMAETARQMKLAKETARKRLSRALARLRQRLSRRGIRAGDTSICAAMPGLYLASTETMPVQLPAVAIAGGKSGNAFAIASEVIRATRMLALKRAVAAVVMFGVVVAGVATTVAQRQPANAPATQPQALWTDEADADSVRKQIIDGTRQNISKLKQMAITWTLETNVDGFPKPEIKYATRGTYQQWMDGNKIETRFTTEQAQNSPDGKLSIQPVSGRTVSVAGVIRASRSDRLIAKPRFDIHENWFDVADWSEERVRLLTMTPPNVQWRAESQQTADGRMVRVIGKSEQGSAQETYNTSRGFNLVLREWFNAKGECYVRQIRTLQEVGQGVWVPIDIDSRSFNTDGNMMLRNHFVIDLGKSRFNDPAAIPADMFALRPVTTAPSSQPEAMVPEASVPGTVAKFLSLVVAGKNAEAAELCDPKSAVPKQLKDFKLLVDLPKLRVDSAIADDKAAIVTTIIGSTEDNRPYQLSIELVNRGAGWLIRDVDPESPDAVRAELERFRKLHPNAKAVSVDPGL